MTLSNQVWRILKVDEVDRPMENWEVMVGTGERCVTKFFLTFFCYFFLDDFFTTFS